jgi:hypothetical protein
VSRGLAQVGAAELDVGPIGQGAGCRREARLCTRRDAVSELEAALAVPLTQRNILCSSVVSDEFFDALELAHDVCRSSPLTNCYNFSLQQRRAAQTLANARTQGYAM